MLKENIRRYKIIEKHMEFTRCGMYFEAKMLLLLLRKGYVKLGLSDEDNNVEQFLDKIGCHAFYSRNGYTAKFRI